MSGLDSEGSGTGLHVGERYRPLGPTAYVKGWAADLVVDDLITEGLSRRAWRPTVTPQSSALGRTGVADGGSDLSWLDEFELQGYLMIAGDSTMQVSPGMERRLVAS